LTRFAGGTRGTCLQLTIGGNFVQLDDAGVTELVGAITREFPVGNIALDERLDDLPRYYAIVDQPAAGVVLGDASDPHMETCVRVADVREMLRRSVRPPRDEAADHSEPPELPPVRDVYNELRRREEEAVAELDALGLEVEKLRAAADALEGIAS
jgi:hypothetical protein